MNALTHNSSHYNIFFNSFWLVLVLWRLLKPSAFFFFPTSFHRTLSNNFINLHKNFLEQLWGKRKQRVNSVHNTRTRQKECRILCWRLLQCQNILELNRIKLFEDKFPTTTQTLLRRNIISQDANFIWKFKKISVFLRT